MHELLDYEKATKIFLERYAFVGQSLAHASDEEIKKYQYYGKIYDKIINKIDQEIAKLA